MYMYKVKDQIKLPHCERRITLCNHHGSPTVHTDPTCVCKTQHGPSCPVKVMSYYRLSESWISFMERFISDSYLFA